MNPTTTLLEKRPLTTRSAPPAFAPPHTEQRHREASTPVKEVAQQRTTFERLMGAAKEEFNVRRFPELLADKALSCLPMNGFPRLRTAYYRLIGVRLGKGSAIIGPVTLSGAGNVASRLSIGAKSVLNGPIHLDLNATIAIGNRVHIGHHVVLVTTEHKVGDAAHRCGPMAPRPITIEDGAWIGARSTIGPGVTIGHGSVVAMGSVVTANVPPNKVVGGNPARAIKPLGD